MIGCMLRSLAPDLFGSVLKVSGNGNMLLYPKECLTLSSLSALIWPCQLTSEMIFCSFVGARPLASVVQTGHELSGRPPSLAERLQSERNMDRIIWDRCPALSAENGTGCPLSC